MSDIELPVNQANIRIDTNLDTPDKIWIYMVDPATGEELEGGSFDAQAFLAHVLKFYQANY